MKDVIQNLDVITRRLPIIDYMIVEGSISEIEKVVKELIKKEYEPVGGLATAGYGYYQVMVKRSN